MLRRRPSRMPISLRSRSVKCGRTETSMPFCRSRRSGRRTRAGRGFCANPRSAYEFALSVLDPQDRTSTTRALAALNRTCGSGMRLSDETSGVRSREAMSFRLQFHEPQGLVGVLVRKACMSLRGQILLQRGYPRGSSPALLLTGRAIAVQSLSRWLEKLDCDRPWCPRCNRLRTGSENSTLM